METPSEACTISGALAVRQHLPDNQPQRSGAAHARGRHVVLRGLGERGRPGEAHVVGQNDHCHRQHGVHQAGTEDRDHDDGEQQAQVRTMSIARITAMSTAPREEASDEAERGPDDDRQRHDGDADGQREPRPRG